LGFSCKEKVGKKAEYNLYAQIKNKIPRYEQNCDLRDILYNRKTVLVQGADIVFLISVDNGLFV